MAGSKTVAGPVAAHPNAAIQAFVELWVKFKRGGLWIQNGYASRGWNGPVRTFDPKFERDIKDFEIIVQKPLDAAWQLLTGAERKEAELECERRGYPIKP